MLKFKLIYKSKATRARLGRIITHRGVIETPVFMPVGTQATVKSLFPDVLKELGYRIILSNTYHLYLRPGADLINELGGLHRFMQWERHILTDSGGFQVYSLAQFRKITEEGVIFKSHIDGSEHFFTPIKSLEVQKKLGSDIVMVLDTCIPYPETYEETKRLTKLTHKWAEESKAYWNRHPTSTQALFGIVQGGMFEDLRNWSAEFLINLDFDGYAIGGLSVGEPMELRNAMIELNTSVLPEHKPRYLMGVGTPLDIVEAVIRGVDMFDCVLPTRNARRGSVFTSQGVLNIRNAEYKKDERPLDENCCCYTCRKFSRAYLRHLFHTKELLAYPLLTLHNLFYYAKLMEQIKKAILEESLIELKKELESYYKNSQKGG